MSDLHDLYQEVILDHNKAPRNFRIIEDADKQADGHNPLCGDVVSIFLKMEDDKVADVSFKGKGCAISKASASLMTEAIKGRTKEDVEKLYKIFHDVVTGQTPDADSDLPLGKLLALSGVSAFPVRVKCATLAWHTMHAAIADSTDPVSTE